VTSSGSMAYQSNDDDGTNLIEAAQSMDLEIFGHFFSALGPIDFESEDGKSVLRRASEAGRLDVMRLLFQHGAPIKMVL
jgi:hypothetical protein